MIWYKWVYKIKYNSDGTLECYKAHLIILGNKQLKGLNYIKTFVPIVKMVTVRAFVVVVVVKKWQFYQIDLHNMFLQGDLDEEVYIYTVTSKIFYKGFNKSVQIKEVTLWITTSSSLLVF